MIFLLFAGAVLAFLWFAIGYKATALIVFLIATFFFIGGWIQEREGRKFHIIWILPILAGIIAFACGWTWVFFLALANHL